MSEAVWRTLRWMHREGIWPNGPRDLWVDAFGILLLVALHRERGDHRLLDEAEEVVAEVERALGRHHGLLRCDAPGDDEQDFRALVMWIHALHRLGTLRPGHRQSASRLAREIHPAFVVADHGVFGRMKGDLSGPPADHEVGIFEAFQAYAIYRLLDPEGLASEIAELGVLVRRHHAELVLEEDEALGTMLWLCHFFPAEPWARVQRARALESLEAMWVNPPGYFCRRPGYRAIKFAHSNHLVSVGLQSARRWPERVQLLEAFFRGAELDDGWDRAPATHVLACCALAPSELVRRPPARR